MLHAVQFQLQFDGKKSHFYLSKQRNKDIEIDLFFKI